MRRRLRVILVPRLGGGLTNQFYELIATIAWAAATGAEVRTPPQRPLRCKYNPAFCQDAPHAAHRPRRLTMRHVLKFHVQ